MPGGLIQLAAVSVQDLYLTGNPQITYFKTAYRRHTNFSVEVIEYQLTGDKNSVNFGTRNVVKFNKNGDLINKMYIKVVVQSVNTLDNKFAWVKRLGHAIIKELDLRIGGCTIDRQFGVWLDIWYELTRQGYHERGYDILIGDVPEMTNFNSCNKPEYTLFIPLQFWFNRTTGLSIPLIALHYHDVELAITFSDLDKLIITDKINFNSKNINIINASVLVDFVYLDTDERRRFAQMGHEYLIEQVQINNFDINNINNNNNFNNYKLSFNHAVKELFWIVQNTNYCSSKPFIYYTNTNINWGKEQFEEAAGCIIDKSLVIGENPCELANTQESLDNIINSCLNTNTNINTNNIIWYKIQPMMHTTVKNTCYNIINNSDQPVYFNPNSLIYNGVSLTNKTSCDIIITDDYSVICENLQTTLSIADLSVPVCDMIDTRYDKNSDPLVNQFNNYGVYLDGSVNPVDQFQLKFNGQDRFDVTDGFYSNYVVPNNCHSNTPKDGINVYSFALYPEESQPSGSSNFSRLDTAELRIKLNIINNIIQNKLTLTVFALNNNVLRFFCGLGGLAYINN